VKPFKAAEAEASDASRPWGSNDTLGKAEGLREIN
jgi:hypothetical protein